MIFAGFERRNEELAPLKVFFWRWIKFFCVGLGMIGTVLFMGVLGYRLIAGFGWMDSILEASMILGGMGPINGEHLYTPCAKLFASAYALFSGLLFISAVGVILSPIMHRLLHQFHLDKADSESSKDS